MQRASTGLYLSGTIFGSATPVWHTATGTASWRFSIAASTFPAEGGYTVTVRATDAVGNVRTSSTHFVIDRSKPRAAGFTTTNAGTVRRLELGDTYTLTFSEPVNPSSIIAGWNGATPQNVVVRARGTGSTQDRLTVYNAANTTLLPLGTVNLRRTDYVNSNNVTFGASGTPSRIAYNGSSVTITLGTPAGTITTAAGAANATWSPASTLRDLAGNAAATTAFSETDNDSDF